MTSSEGFVPAAHRTPAGFIVLLIAGSVLTLLGFWVFLGGIVAATSSPRPPAGSSPTATR